MLLHAKALLVLVAAIADTTLTIIIAPLVCSIVQHAHLQAPVQLASVITT
jgi:hypothetical protein